MSMEWQENDYVISTDKTRLPAETIREILSGESYWARGRTLEQVKKSIANSLCFGIYHGDRLIGFARVITDYVSFYYLCDVIVTAAYRGKGVGSMLMRRILASDELKGIRGFLLTRDAHAFYRKYGFMRSREYQERFMMR
jgi:predicted N-acetyltransferase YhbS